MASFNYVPPPSLADFFTSTKRVRAVRGPIGCCAGDTLVLTESGPVRIDAITHPMRVLSWDEKQGRFRLAQASAAYPKGMDVLYRVRGPHGEWRAAGHHRVLDALGEYRLVRQLRRGDALRACSLVHEQNAGVSACGSYPEDVRRSTRIVGDSPESCGSLFRRCGRRLLRVSSRARAFVRGRLYAPIFCWVAGLVERIRFELQIARRAMLGLPPLVAAPPAFPTHGVSGYAGRIGQSTRVVPQSASIEGGPSVELPLLNRSFHSSSVTEWPIISTERCEAQEPYWDLSVAGTRNYVTVDGCIHHNSTKSTAMIMELLRRSAEQIPGPDGIRRTRHAIVRNTLPQLKSTCLVSIQQLLRPIIRYKVSENTVHVKMNDIESEWILLPLDTPENVQRLLSLELTYGWVSEFREIDPDVVMNVLSRTGRYPSVAVGGPTNYGVVMETNSFSEDSPWFDQLELNLPGNWGYFVQPGAREPEADWLQYLQPDYYKDLIESNSDTWVEQYIDNKIGPSLSGQAVFAKTYVHAFHRAAEALQPDYSRPLVIGMDTGRNPAAVVGQLDARGRLLVLGSVWAENSGMERFVNEVLKPFLTERFSRGMFYVVIDPAARQRSQIGEESVLEAVMRLGFNVITASTNNLAPRLRAVERYLNQQIAGGPALLFDPVWNKDLLQAMQYGYRYPRNKKGTLNEIPEKTHPSSDLADGLQYLCLGAGSSQMARALRPKPTYKPPPPTGAWT